MPGCPLLPMPLGIPLAQGASHPQGQDERLRSVPHQTFRGGSHGRCRGQLAGPPCGLSPQAMPLARRPAAPCRKQLHAHKLRAGPCHQDPGSSRTCPRLFIRHVSAAAGVARTPRAAPSPAAAQLPWRMQTPHPGGGLCRGYTPSCPHIIAVHS